jgi:diacylglycerol kinase
MVAEMLNYAIEKVCDLIDISLNPKIRDIKDICAGAVLVSGIILGIVGLWIIILRFVY